MKAEKVWRQDYHTIVEVYTTYIYIYIHKVDMSVTDQMLQCLAMNAQT